MPPSPEDFAPTIERFSGWADLYDRHRPEPPAVLADVVSQFGGLAFPTLVVDLGCGTVLSTRFGGT